MFLDLSAELLNLGCRIRFRPGGHSMQPTIRDGEVITVEPIDALAVRRGDILFYRDHRSRVVVHRVVGIEIREEAGGVVFTLCGDASPACDEPVLAEQILGRVVAVERAGRRVSLIGHMANFKRAAYRRAVRLKAIVSADSR